MMILVDYNLVQHINNNLHPKPALYESNKTLIKRQHFLTQTFFIRFYTLLTKTTLAKTSLAKIPLH